MLASVDVRTELDALFCQLSQFGQRKNLKAARVGQQRAVPRRKSMQSAETTNDLNSWPEKKVVRVAQNYSCIKLVLEPFEPNALQRALRSDGHKNGSLYHRAAGCDNAGPGLAFSREYFPI